MHVAIIMDGNGRWANARHLPRTQGHIEGVKRVEEVVECARRRGIRYLTIFTFSTENWFRPEDEVSMLIRTLINVISEKAKRLANNGIRVNFIGRRDGVPPELLKAMDEAMALTGHDMPLTVNVAFNYGGRAEIIDAVRQLCSKAVSGSLDPQSIEDKDIAAFLYTAGQPDPDLLIRTSGEQRISNFLLWQLSYAELYFTSKCWPEFTAAEFEGALAEYAQRERRYGRVKTS